MIPSLGAYYRPNELAEALELLAREPGARVLAGGTDLLLESAPVESLVDITHLGLDRVQRDAGDDLELGATARVEDLRAHPDVAAWADGVVVGACLEFGTLPVRHAATVGGNIVHALPAADLVPALLVLDATLELARWDAGAAVVRRRQEPLDGFATGPFTTRLQPAELLVGVRLPVSTRTRRADFRKIGRVQKDLAVVNAAVALERDAEDLGPVRLARVAVGAVHPTVVRVPAAEAELVGVDPDDAGAWSGACARAVEDVRTAVRPIDDVRASAAWRRHVVGVLVQRALDAATDPRRRGRTPRVEEGPLYRPHGVAGGSHA